MALRVREGLDAKFDRPLTKGLSNRFERRGIKRMHARHVTHVEHRASEAQRVARGGGALDVAHACACGVDAAVGEPDALDASALRDSASSVRRWSWKAVEAVER